MKYMVIGILIFGSIVLGWILKNMDSLYVSVRTSFRHGSNRLSCMVLAGLYFNKYQKRNE